MSLGTTQAFFVQSGGNNMNGGSSSNNSAAYTSTNGGWNSGTLIFTPGDGSTPSGSVNVGDYASVYNDGTTGTPVFIGRVTAVGAGVNGTITISSTNNMGTAPTTSGTARSIKVGGAWAGPSGSITFPLLPLTGFANCKDGSGNMPCINFQCSGTGAIDAAMTATVTNNITGPYMMRGYKASVGDGDPATNGDTQANQVNYKYRVDGSTNAIVLLTISAASVYMKDFQFSNNGTTSSNNGVTITGAGTSLERVVVHDVRGNGISVGGGGNVCIECEAYSCNGSNTANFGGFQWSAGVSNQIFNNCTSHHNTGSNSCGWASSGSSGNGVILVNCEADDNGAHGLFEVTTNTAHLSCIDCGFDNNGADGIRLGRQGGGGSVTIENCNFEGNGQSTGTGYAINRTDSQLYRITVNNPRTWNNKTGTFNGTGIADIIGAVTGSATAYNSASGGDFRLLGSDAASAKNAGRGYFTQTKASYSGTQGYPDIAAAQHQDAGGTAGLLVHPGMAGGMRG